MNIFTWTEFFFFHIEEMFFPPYDPEDINEYLDTFLNGMVFNHDLGLI